MISRGFSEIEDEQISEKITSLRSYYDTEKWKEKASKASVAGTSDVYVSFWRFINDLDSVNDNLIPRKSYSNIDLETEEAVPSRESGRNVSVKPERLLKSKALERTGKIMGLVSQRHEMRKTPMQWKLKRLQKVLNEYLMI